MYVCMYVCEKKPGNYVRVSLASSCIPLIHPPLLYSHPVPFLFSLLLSSSSSSLSSLHDDIVPFFHSDTCKKSPCEQKQGDLKGRRNKSKRNQSKPLHCQEAYLPQYPFSLSPSPLHSYPRSYPRSSTPLHSSSKNPSSSKSSTGDASLSYMPPDLVIGGAIIGEEIFLRCC